MRTKGTYEVLGVWKDDGEIFNAIISDDVVISPGMDEGDKALLCDLTREELLNEGDTKDAMFDILSCVTISTLN